MKYILIATILVVSQWFVSIPVKAQPQSPDIGLQLEGLNMKQANHLLHINGWTSVKTEIEEWNIRARIYKQAGYSSVQDCSGTALGYCWYSYEKIENGIYYNLKVAAVGQDIPQIVDSWELEEEHLPPKQEGCTDCQ